MPLALILSSYVAAGRMGGGGQVLALAACGFDPVLVPTVLLGRSPARGGRGQATDSALFQTLIDDVEADGLFPRIDLLVTGHFSTQEQAASAARTIERVRAVAPQAVVVVDPILGDAPKGLYVKPEVASAVAGLLLPLADWITPNLWELGHLSGQATGTVAEARDAARSLGRKALITSAPAEDGDIGLLLWDGRDAMLIAHPRAAYAPNGTGDLVTALFGAGLAEGLSPLEAAERAAGAVRLAVEAAAAGGLQELPLSALGARLTEPARGLTIRPLA